MARSPDRVAAALDPLGVDGLETVAGEVTDAGAVERALEWADPMRVPPVQGRSEKTPTLAIGKICNDLPNTPVPATLNPAQERLAADMREAWADFAAGKTPWPEFGSRERVMSFGTTQSQIGEDFASKHHAELWP